jgi:hypothetical protein
MADRLVRHAPGRRVDELSCSVSPEDPWSPPLRRLTRASVSRRADTAFQEGSGRRIADGVQALAQFVSCLIIAFTETWQLSLVVLASLPLIGGATAGLSQVELCNIPCGLEATCLSPQTP